MRISIVLAPAFSCGQLVFALRTWVILAHILKQEAVAAMRIGSVLTQLFVLRPACTRALRRRRTSLMQECAMRMRLFSNLLTSASIAQMDLHRFSLCARYEESCRMRNVLSSCFDQHLLPTCTFALWHICARLLSTLPERIRVFRNHFFLFWLACAPGHLVVLCDQVTHCV